MVKKVKVRREGIKKERKNGGRKMGREKDKSERRKEGKKGWTKGSMEWIEEERLIER